MGIYGLTHTYTFFIQGCFRKGVQPQSKYSEPLISRNCLFVFCFCFFLYLFFQIYVSESDWHKEQQFGLRAKVENTAGLNIRHYAGPEQVCDAIKQVSTVCIATITAYIHPEGHGAEKDSIYYRHCTSHELSVTFRCWTFCT